jgi:hypothetical protein
MAKVTGLLLSSFHLWPGSFTPAKTRAECGGDCATDHPFFAIYGFGGKTARLLRYFVFFPLRVFVVLRKKAPCGVPSLLAH